MVLPPPPAAMHAQPPVGSYANPGGIRDRSAPKGVPLSADDKETIYRLNNDLEYFCFKLMWIKTKSVKHTVRRFTFNAAQRYIHKRLEEMKARTGKVRAIILKGRQQGSSTYVTARFYWKACCLDAQNIYIMSHDSKSASTLFGKVDFYHKRTLEAFKPHANKANSKQLKLDNDSEYTIGTAGTEDSGRGDTIHYLHLSEAASYTDHEDVKSGIMQTVPDEEGTEVIVECTAKGMNWFYEFCMNALAGPEQKSWNGFELIFVPWFWEPGYVAEIPDRFVLDEEEAFIKRQYNLTNEQMAWRRNKVAMLGERKFKQEYPNTVAEAFQASGDPFFEQSLITAARKSKVRAEVGVGARVLGVDPAREGDRTVIALRQGRQVIKLWKYTKMDSMQLAGILCRLIDKYEVDMTFIDYGMGHGTIDRMREMGRGHQIIGINFGGRSSDPAYLNKRAEMYHNCLEWLQDGEVSLPDDDDMEVDLASIPQAVETSSGKIKLKPKAEIKKETGRSPDISDSIVLTFAAKVKRKREGGEITRTKNTREGSALRTQNRVRNIGSRPQRHGRAA